MSTHASVCRVSNVMETRFNAHRGSGVRNPMAVPVSLALFPIRVGLLEPGGIHSSVEYSHHSPSILLLSYQALFALTVGILTSRRDIVNLK